MNTDTDIEQWLPVPGYEGSYEASTHGRIRSLDRSVFAGRYRKDGSPVYRALPGKPMPGSRCPAGYFSTTMHRDGTAWQTHRHCVVARTFLGPRPEGLDVCHNDGDPANNRPANLRYDTRTANHADKVQHGTAPKGARNTNAKLTESDVIKIRWTYRRGGITQKDLGAKYGVHFGNVSAIILGKSWTDLPLAPTEADLALYGITTC